MIKFEVAEELKNHLVMHTENAGPVVLASVNDKFIFIYMCMDYVEYFDNSCQLAAAERDIAKFMRFWKSRGKKLYNEEV